MARTFLSKHHNAPEISPQNLALSRPVIMKWIREMDLDNGFATMDDFL